MNLIIALLNQIIDNTLVDFPTRLRARILLHGLIWPRGLYHGLTR